MRRLLERKGTRRSAMRRRGRGRGLTADHLTGTRQRGDEAYPSFLAAYLRAMQR